jgi:hypothetical protein
MTAPATPPATLRPREAGALSNHSHARTVVSFTPSLQHPPTTADTPETAA